MRDPPPGLKMLQRVLLAPVLLALAHARAAQDQSPTSNALDRVTIDVAGDGKQPMVVELPPPLQLHYNVTTGVQDRLGPVVIDLTEGTHTPHHQDSVRESGGQVCLDKWCFRRKRMFCGSRDGRSAFPVQSLPPASFLTHHHYTLLRFFTKEKETSSWAREKCVVNSVHCTFFMFSVGCAVLTVLSTVFSVLCSVFYIQCTVQCFMFSVMLSVKCTVLGLQC